MCAASRRAVDAAMRHPEWGHEHGEWWVEVDSTQAPDRIAHDAHGATIRGGLHSPEGISGSPVSPVSLGGPGTAAATGPSEPGPDRPESGESGAHAGGLRLRRVRDPRFGHRPVTIGYTGGGGKHHHISL